MDLARCRSPGDRRCMSMWFKVSYKHHAGVQESERRCLLKLSGRQLLGLGAVLAAYTYLKDKLPNSQGFPSLSEGSSGSITHSGTSEPSGACRSQVEGSSTQIRELPCHDSCNREIGEGNSSFINCLEDKSEPDVVSSPHSNGTTNNVNVY